MAKEIVEVFYQPDYAKIASQEQDWRNYMGPRVKARLEKRAKTYRTTLIFTILVAIFLAILLFVHIGTSRIERTLMQVELDLISNTVDENDRDQESTKATLDRYITLLEELEVQNDESDELPLIIEPSEEMVEEHAEAREPEIGVSVIPQATVVTVSAVYASVPLDDALKAYIIQTAEEAGYPAEILFGMARKESTFNPKATHTNSNGTVDKGMWQINSSNFTSLAKKFNMSRDELEEKIFDPYFNLQLCIQMLNDSKANHPDNYNTLLMCYNMGGGGAKKLWNEGVYSSKYSRAVIAFAEEYGWSDPGHL